ncbi:hypothetical protein HDU99_005743, partial [Rhizoclosmatium hyalinum]
MGKNLVASVLEAKGFLVVDLGVSVPKDEIIKAVAEYNPDVIGLSGLIVPSLHQMVHTVKALSEIGIETPILIGGAATTKQNTIVNIVPHYSGPVLHVLDAARALYVVCQVTNLITRQDFLKDTATEYLDLLEDYNEGTV